MVSEKRNALRIFYDCLATEGQEVGGVSRYFTELFAYISKLPDIEVLVGVKETRNVYLQGLGVPASKGSWHSAFAGISFKGKRLLCRWLFLVSGGLFHDSETLNWLYSRRLICQGDFDLWHFTGLYMLPLLANNRIKKPLVITIHDLTPERFAWNPKILKKRKELALTADRIIAVSRKTKHDICEYWGIAEDRIDVVYHAPSVVSRDSGFGCTLGDYLLFIGARAATYKNFSFFVRALVPFLLKNLTVKVICTGMAFSDGEKMLFRQLGIENRFVQIFVKESDFFSLYKHARAFIYPSLYEGFGIPILDAFVSGCPVILARASCFPEIAQDAALYFDPTNEVELLKCVQLLSESSDLRRELIEKGRKRVKAFSWSIASAATVEVYERVLQEWK